MNPRINFYLLPQLTPAEWDTLALQWMENAWLLGKRQIYLLAESLAQQQRLHVAVWTLGEASFLPYYVHTKPAAGQEFFLQLGEPATENPATGQLLLNLSTTIPAMYAQFEHVWELIPHDESRRQQARERYRFYQRHGCQVSSQPVL